MKTKFLATAIELSRGIWATRVRDRNGDLTWLRPAATGMPNPQTIGPYLYEGASGIALFFAALAKTTGDRAYRDQSLEILRPIRRRFAALAADPEAAEALDRLGLGGHQGLGSLIWCFLHIGEMVNEKELIAEASNLVSLITPARLGRDRILDVLLGSAGSLLALLAVYETSTAPEAIGDLAHRCAAHLLRNRVLTSGVHTWQTLPNFSPLTGFAHGATGIAYALSRLADRVPGAKAELLAAASESLDFEDRFYSSEKGNWKDLRRPDEDHYECMWCHGAAGIALGRLLMPSVLGRKYLGQARQALETTLQLPLTPIDDLCCGNLGRVAVLAKASRFLNEERLWEAALKLASKVLDRAQQSEGLRWRVSGASPGENPAFFTGAAGCGYALLQLASPHTLPCPLVLS